MTPALYLYDDPTARAFEPFSATRPVGELLFGGFTARERAEQVFGLTCEGHLAGAGLVGFDEAGAAPGLPADARSPRRARVLLNSRFVPEWGAALPEVGDRAVALVCADRLAGWVAPPGVVVPEARLLRDGATRLGSTESAGAREVAGQWVDTLWGMMDRNPERIAADIRHVFEDASANRPRNGQPSGVHLLGGNLVSVAETAEIEPGAVIDTRTGPIRLDSGSRVQAFTRLGGPAWIGRDSVVLGGSVSSVSLGPVCKIRGEVEGTIVTGYSNKAHDGFLGHAILGRWVNLGAGTTNSDLKNNYGPVRLRLPSGIVHTGLTKVGCFLGDHVKTAIGTLLGTGTVIGAGSNVFGGTPATYVPPFSWGVEAGGGGPPAAYDLRKFLEVAEVVMGRRGVELTPGVRAVLERAWHAGRQDEDAGDAS